jgi:hypothetical protein
MAPNSHVGGWICSITIGQYTNVAIECYHGTLKAQLKLRKRILVGRHVDWCIHELIRHGSKDTKVSEIFSNICGVHISVKIKVHFTL